MQTFEHLCRTASASLRALSAPRGDHETKAVIRSKLAAHIIPEIAEHDPKVAAAIRLELARISLGLPGETPLPRARA